MGLLEDAIAQGNSQQMAQLSPLFAPGQAQQFEAAANASLARGDLPYYNPATGRQWGEHAAIFQNNDTEALNRRDALRAKVLDSVGHLDPDLQGAILRQWGLGRAPESGPPNIQGMSPTNALFAPNSIEGGDMGLGGGSKLRNEMAKIKYNYDLGAGDRADNLAIRQLTAMAAAQRAQSDEENKIQQNNFRNQQLGNQRLGLVKEIGQMVRLDEQAAQMGNVEAAARLPNLRKLHNQMVLEATMAELKDVTGGAEIPWWNMEGAFGAQPPTGTPQRGRTAAPPSAISSAPGDLQGGWGAARSRPAAGRRGGSVTRIE